MIVFSLETNNQILKPSSFHCVRISSSQKNNCLAFGCSFVQYYINEIIWRLFRSQFGNIGDVFGYFSNHMTVMQFSSEFLVWFQWLLFPKSKIIESGSTREMIKKEMYVSCDSLLVVIVSFVELSSSRDQDSRCTFHNCTSGALAAPRSHHIPKKENEKNSTHTIYCGAGLSENKRVIEYWPLRRYWAFVGKFELLPSQGAARHKDRDLWTGEEEAGPHVWLAH